MVPNMIQDNGSSITSAPLQVFSMMSPNFENSYAWLRDLKPEERGLYLIHLLLGCANHVSTGELDKANVTLDRISQLASPDGDTMQRIAAYFAESLAERILKSWSGLYRTLRVCRMNVLSEEMVAKKLCFELFPFLKVAYVVTNQSIVEAMEGEKMVHIIDLHASECVQWVSVMQMLRARPDGPPHLRITGVHHQQEVLQQVSSRLNREAEKLGLLFQFNPVVCRLENLDFEQLRVKTGEALAVSAVLKLHTLLAFDGETKLLDGFLNGLWSLSPKIVVVTEQDSNHNGLGLMERVSEALYYYAALFDCLESTKVRVPERKMVEKLYLGEEIKNIIACEGVERRERHEKLEKWMQRLGMAGFGTVPLSYISMLQAKRLLQGYTCHGYRMKEENGCLIICWQDRPLFSTSLWRCRR